MYTPGVTLALPNIAYERLCVLLNLVALFSGLANGEDRSSAEGIKRAVVGFAVRHEFILWLRYHINTRIDSESCRNNILYHIYRSSSLSEDYGGS